jgi:hypothetical protein
MTGVDPLEINHYGHVVDVLRLFQTPELTRGLGFDV